MEIQWNGNLVFLLKVIVLIFLFFIFSGCSNIERYPVDYNSPDNQTLLPKDWEEQQEKKEKTEKLIKRQNELEGRCAGQLRPTFR